MLFDKFEKEATLFNLTQLSRESFIKILDDNQLIEFAKLEKLQNLYLEEIKENEFLRGILTVIKRKEI